MIREMQRVGSPEPGGRPGAFPTRRRAFPRLRLYDFLRLFPERDNYSQGEKGERRKFEIFLNFARHNKSREPGVSRSRGWPPSPVNGGNFNRNRPSIIFSPFL